MGLSNQQVSTTERVTPSTAVSRARLVVIRAWRVKHVVFAKIFVHGIGIQELEWQKDIYCCLP